METGGEPSAAESPEDIASGSVLTDAEADTDKFVTFRATPPHLAPSSGWDATGALDAGRGPGLALEGLCRVRAIARWAMYLGTLLWCSRLSHTPLRPQNLFLE